MRARSCFAFLFVAGLASCGGDDFTSSLDRDAGNAGAGGGTGGTAASHDGGASTGGPSKAGAAAGGASTGGALATGGARNVEAGAMDAGSGDGSSREGSAPKGCSPITTFAEFENALFDNSRPLAKLNAGAGQDVQLRYPRAFGNAGGLVYQVFYLTGTIWLTGDQDTDIGAPMSSPIDQTGLSSTAPFWWQEERPGAFSHDNFVVNRWTGTSGERTQLYGATVDSAGVAKNHEPVPAPFNAPEPTTQSSSGLALSRDRAWWMVNLDSALNMYLYTAPLDGSSPPSLLTLEIENDCEVREFEFGSWVTPDGKLLFVNASERDAACKYDVNAPTDVYAFELDETGKPIGKGHRLALSRPGTTEADVSLSADFCTLYYVTNAAPGGPLRIHRMRRIN